MKKWNMMLLALLLLAVPSAGSAQDLPELFTGVYESVGEGLAQGAALAAQAAAQELTLDMQLGSERLEEGKRVPLTLTAGNPLPHETAVTLTLKLPPRLQADGETTWQAVLPAAQLDAQTGELTPSVTVFTREIALAPGGESEQTQLECEMSMGTRFYRAGAPLALCVSDVSVSARLGDEKSERLQPGDAFAYHVEIVNGGDAPKDVSLELTLPEAVQIAGALPEGFELADGTLRGVVHAQAAEKTSESLTASKAEIVVEAAISADALEQDADARRLIAATLRADGERVAMPRLLVCAPRISARLMADADSLEAGEETTLSVMVVNTGLAKAQVDVSCVLPEGLTLLDEKEATGGEADEALVPGTDGGTAGAEPALADAPSDLISDAPAMAQDNRTLIFSVQMDAAQESENGVIAHTKVIDIPVRAEIAQGSVGEKLLGASLAWRVSGEAAQLGEAVALRVKSGEVLGLTRGEWNSMFWTGMLLLATVLCLYAAVRKNRKEEEYCFE